MTGGNPDYCTSCDIDGSYPILDLGNQDETGNPLPTCLTELPAQRAIVIVQNNKLLGVLNLATQYGGANENGTRTDQADADPDLGLGSNQSENPPSFEDCPEDVEDCTSLPPPPGSDGEGPEGQGPEGAGPEGEGGMPMDPEPNMADIPPEIRHDIGMERHLPKIMDIIEMYDILGIGANRDIEDTCTFASGEERFPRNMHPSIMYLAIPCPVDCMSCAMTR